MLEHQPWMAFAPDMKLEWQQCKDEGKMVDAYKEVCDFISNQSNSHGFENLADEIAKKMSEVPVVENYPYNEPSDLEGIVAEKPVRRHNLTYTLTDRQFEDKIAGAWCGRIAGCLLGKPVEVFMYDRLQKLLKGTKNFPLSRYITADEFTDELITDLGLNINSCWADKIGGAAPIDDDTNYTVFTLKLIEKYGTDFRPNDVLEAWLDLIPMFATCTAERVAYRNAAIGMRAPQTATYRNPYREWIGAQIRGDFFGYINPGKPAKASELAWRDASISHIKNGIYGEMFVAAMIATAAVSDDIMTVIEAGLDEIPLKSRLREEIDHVIHWYRAGLTYEDVIKNIHSKYDETNSHHWCHTISNAMIVVTALLYGNKEFGKSICYAVEATFDTDCNGATVGSIIGIMNGECNIPEYWTNCFNKQLRTSVSDYTLISVDSLVHKTIELIKNK